MKFANIRMKFSSCHETCENILSVLQNVCNLLNTHGKQNPDYNIYKVPIIFQY